MKLYYFVENYLKISRSLSNGKWNFINISLESWRITWSTLSEFTNSSTWRQKCMKFDECETGRRKFRLLFIKAPHNLWNIGISWRGALGIYEVSPQATMTITDQLAIIEESGKSPIPAETTVLHRAITVHFTAAGLLNRWARKFSRKYHTLWRLWIQFGWWNEITDTPIEAIAFILTTSHIFNL